MSKKLIEYLKQIEDKISKNTTSENTSKFVYRGVDRFYDDNLIPAFFRNYIQDDLCEYDLLYSFISESYHYIKDVPSQLTVAWMEIAQHYGMPTRLLDFSYNPMVALYFTCINSTEEDGCLWILNETKYSELCKNNRKNMSEAWEDNLVIEHIIKGDILKIKDTVEDYINVELPWLYKPFYRYDRMHNQSSLFMMWGFNHNSLERQLKDLNEDSICERIVINKDDKKELIEDLDEYGINVKYLFPGVDSVGEYISNMINVKNI